MPAFEANPKAPGLLPAEYQTQIDEQNQKRALAMALMQMGGQQPQGQMVSGHYVPPAFTQMIAPLMNAFLGRRADAEAQDNIRKARQAAGAAEQEGLKGLNPEDLNSLNQGAASPFENVRKQAEELRKAFQEQRKSWFTAAAPVATPESVIRSGGRAEALDPVQPWEQDSYEGRDAQGNPVKMPMFRGSRGQAPVFPPAPGANINNTLGPKFAEQELGRTYEGLRKQLPDVMSTARNMPQLAEAFGMLQKVPLNTGALANEVTGIQALSKFLGLPVPDKVPATQYLQNTLLPAFREGLKNVAPTGSTSNIELQLAKQMAISAERDPRALNALIAQVARLNKAMVDDYNKQLRLAHAYAGKVGLPVSPMDEVQWSIPGDTLDEGMMKDLLGTPLTSLLQRMPPAQETPPPPSRINAPKGEDPIDAELRRRGLLK